MEEGYDIPMAERMASVAIVKEILDEGLIVSPEKFEHITKEDSDIVYDYADEHGFKVDSGYDHISRMYWMLVYPKPFYEVEPER